MYYLLVSGSSLFVTLSKPAPYIKWAKNFDPSLAKVLKPKAKTPPKQVGPGAPLAWA